MGEQYQETERSLASRPYWIAVAATSVGLALAYLLGAWLPGGPSTGLSLVAAVTVAAWRGGAVPGLLSAALGALGAIGLPFGGAPGGSTRTEFGVAELAVFVAVAVLISILFERLHRARRELQARCRQAERDVRERRRASDAIVMSNRRKDEFLATLSHELRNALAPTRNALEILRRPEIDASTVGYAKALIERQLGQLIRLVDDLLDVSRIGRGSLELRCRNVDAAAALRHAVDSIAPMIHAAGQRMSLSLPPDPVFLHADPARLAQVFSNVLLNACKFTPSGGRIRVRMVDDGQAVTVSVRDNGIGIAPDMLGRVFEMFERGTATHERPSSGLGIGLALARRLVELHAGTIEAQSEGVGKGAEFVIRLPSVRGNAAGATDANMGENDSFSAPAA